VPAGTGKGTQALLALPGGKGAVSLLRHQLTAEAYKWSVSFFGAVVAHNLRGRWPLYPPLPQE
jgi:hypothetical protein